MPCKRPGLVERSFDRALFAAAVLYAAAMVTQFGVRSPNRVEYMDDSLAPGELDAAILQTAGNLQAQLATLPPPIVEVPPYHKYLTAAHAAGTLDGPLTVPATLPRAVDFGNPIPDLTPRDPRGVRLAQPLPPGRLAVSAGRSVLRVANDDRQATSWVTVGGLFDTAAQRQAFRDAGYAEFRCQVWIGAVEAQRQEQLPDGTYTAWEQVAMQPLPGTPDLSTVPWSDRAALAEAHTWMKASQEQLTQPPFREVIAGSTWQHPFGDDATRSDLVPVWVHDTNVIPGHTYRYRMRVDLWNAYVAREDLLANADDASRCLLAGQWSAPSEPYTVARDVQFFICGVSPAAKSVYVEVWKWYEGTWFRRSFPVTVGEVIGTVCDVAIGRDGAGHTLRAPVDFSTGALALDVRFDELLTTRDEKVTANNDPATAHDTAAAGDQVNGPGTAAAVVVHLRDTTTAALTYVDALGDQVRTKFAAQDRYDPIRKQLAVAVPPRPAPAPEPSPPPRPTVPVGPRP
ncbi:MAG: hypothetical protein PVJ57_19820 [Phycisphaerae bacterium]|jgi:hypothetical protein